MKYADNDDKYIMLPDEGDYVVEYIGNDTGTMNCTIEKYEDGELVKSIDYKDIPLSKDKKYSNFFADGGTQEYHFIILIVKMEQRLHPLLQTDLNNRLYRLIN